MTRKYEYLTVGLPYSGERSELQGESTFQDYTEELLNSAADEGWRLVTIYVSNNRPIAVFEDYTDEEDTDDADLPIVPADS